MPLGTHYRAISNGLGWINLESLSGLNGKIRDHVRRRLGTDEFELDLLLSNSLRPRYPPCVKCKGATRVETNAVRSHYGRLNFKKSSTLTCPQCEGLGVILPNL
jgi:hypothetical protein